MAYDRRRGEEELPLVERTVLDYEVEIGRAYVPVGEKRSCVILDPARASILHAWTDALIPASDVLPAAGDIGAAEYIDATAFEVPVIRSHLLNAIDAVERLAHSHFNSGFVDCPTEGRVAVLREFESTDTAGSFQMIRDLTYEAYYANARVLTALQEATGWQYEGAIAGSSMEPFDEALLAGMKAIEPRYREA